MNTTSSTDRKTNSPIVIPARETVPVKITIPIAPKIARNNSVPIPVPISPKITLSSKPTISPKIPISPKISIPQIPRNYSVPVIPSKIVIPVNSKIEAKTSPINRRNKNSVKVTEPEEETVDVDVLDLGLKSISDFQKGIIDECVEKRSCALHVPMGSGKTRISLVLSLIHQKKYEGGKTIIIVAKTLISEWIAEITKVFGKSLKYEVLHGDFIKNKIHWKPECDLIITTPQVVTDSYVKHNVAPQYWYHERPQQFGPTIKYYRIPHTPYLNHESGVGYMHSIKWANVIIDEAQNYQNVNSNRCLAMASLCAHHRWLLSGTLFEEPRNEKIFGFYLLINSMEIPRNLPDFKEYIQSDNYSGIKSTLVYRRKNETYTPPNVNKHIITHPLTEPEAKIYSNIKNIIVSMKKTLDKYKHANDAENVKKFTSYIVGMISNLRQSLICPLIPITSVAITTSDLEQKNELADIFMNCVNELQLDEWLNDINSLYSSRIDSLCKALQKHNSRVVVFSCFRKSLDVIKVFAPEKIPNRPLFTVSGTQSIKSRTETIENFKASSNGILLLTYDIGSTGLNLQCSDTVMILDLFYNAGKTEQAIARVVRQGQESKIVNIYYFTANTGIENAMLKMQKSKKEVANELMNGKMQSKITKISTDEIIKLINVEDNVEILKKLI